MTTLRETAQDFFIACLQILGGNAWKEEVWEAFEKGNPELYNNVMNCGDLELVIVEQLEVKDRITIPVHAEDDGVMIRYLASPANTEEVQAHNLL
jgi:hypothetical protein